MDSNGRCLRVGFAAGCPAMHPQWEYSVLKLPTKTPFLTGTDFGDVQFAKHLNAFGAEGWEVVSVVGIQRADGPTNYVMAVMKRPKG